MKRLILIFALFAPTLANAGYHTIATPEVDWPTTKYQAEDCIIPTNVNWSWYGKFAYVVDVVFSKQYEKFVYVLDIDDADGTGLFSIAHIENNTAKLIACPK